MRYFFEIGYDGSLYHGWQRQPNATSVQDEVEKALEKLMRKKTSIVGSSRTDTGVHCTAQFFHLDTDPISNIPAWIYRLNSILPQDIAIHSIRPTKPNAHARYDAIQRYYEYRITQQKNPFLQHYAYPFFRKIDLSAMNEAAKLLVGKRNFQAFSKVKTDVNHFICEVTQAAWRTEDTLLIFDIVANRFLRGMVRAIVGSLLDVGMHKFGIQDFDAMINSKDRKKAGANAPPQGLYLRKVNYPDSVFIN